MKKIMVIFDVPDMTLKQYEKSVEDLKLTGGLSSSGQLYHVAGQDPNTGNLVVTDVFESEEAFNRFSDKLMPVLKKLGVTHVKPQIIPVHNIILNGSYFLYEKSYAYNIK
jgi:hypothetical protein